MPTVLVVDDQEDMRVLVRAVLESDGLDVVGEADSGSAAIERWREMQPDVMVLDNRMPGLTGLDVAEAILNECPGQAIVLFTAFMSDGVAEAASRLGVRAVLPKTDLAQLPATVRAVV